MPKSIRQRWRTAVYPSMRKMVKFLRGWPVSGKYSGKQGMVPSDPKLAQKIGIKSGANVLCFAGCHGDWARALSTQCKVRYTDISKQMTKSAALKKGMVRSFVSRPAELLVRRPKVYDWTFSFEPYPLESTLSLVFVRSLLNNKGCIVVERGSTSKKFFSSAEEIASLYGASAKKESNTIRAKDRSLLKNEKISVITLRTNDVARGKAMFDLKLMHELNLAKTKKEILVADALCKKFGVSEKDLTESMERLEKISYGKLWQVGKTVKWS